MPPGAYTTARTCNRGYRVFEWTTHIERTAASVAAMLDGSARLFDEEELRDMRHWSPLAAEADLKDNAFPPFYRKR